MEADTLNEKPKVHHGRNMRRIREIMGVKQEVIAEALKISQPAVHKLEQKEEIDDETLKKVAEVLHVPVDAIKNYQEDAIVNIFNNTFHDSSSAVGTTVANGTGPNFGCTFNPMDKIVELYERLLEAEREKNNKP